MWNVEIRVGDVILETKLNMPSLRTKFVSRSRLTNRLHHASHHKLTLIVAPAGFGKTTLLCEWGASIVHGIGWLSLDEQDNNLRRFLRYLINAFQRIFPDIGSVPLALLDAVHQPKSEVILTQLVNDLVATSDEGIVILDDYHLITHADVHHALDFLLTYLPQNIHFIVATRIEPPINLNLLRGRAQLLEFDSAQLRFTAVEADRFLRDIMELDLNAAERVSLEMRIEGWVTGLQLAGLSLQVQEDKSAFLSAFSGTNRFIADYLFEEVLSHQSKELQRFLLFTSVVDEMCGELCDALLNVSDSQQRLETLEKSQLFIVPLDDKKQWYRYHHLFTDLLRRHLKQAYPNELPRIQRQASNWFEGHNRHEEAIQYSLLAGDFDHAANLIEAAFTKRDWIRHDMHKLLVWFDTLPNAIVESRPRLLLSHAWLVYEIFENRWEVIEANLRRVEAHLHLSDARSSDEIATMGAQVDLLRANHARYLGEPQRVIILCEQALERLPENEMYIRSGVMAHLASAYESLGNIGDASKHYEASLRACRTANNIDGLLFATAHLIDVYRIGGELKKAEEVYAKAHAYTDQRSGPDIGMIQIAIGSVYYEYNQLTEAKSYFEMGIDLCRPFSAWRAGMIAGSCGLARVLAANGYIDDALTVLVQVENEVFDASEVNQLDITRVRVHLASENYSAATLWAKRQEVPNLDEAGLLTYIRVLLAQSMLETTGIRVSQVSIDPLEEAKHLLKGLFDGTNVAWHIGRAIEFNILQALCHDENREPQKSLKYLEDALILAEPEDYIRIFVDEGLPLYQLLIRLQTRPGSLAVSEDYVNRIRSAFPQDVRQSVSVSGSMRDALTASELDTLRLLASERSINDIASELSVAVSTVRTYTKRIYSKLDAHSRAEAVYRAKELKLL